MSMASGDHRRAGTLFVAVGMWLLLPGGGNKRRLLGVLLGLIGLGLFASKALPLGEWTSDFVFWSLAAITIISAAATVTLRSPVYCKAILVRCFSLLGTAGLFLFQGAQFLGVATVVVYAGAILVTFLFVVMLANPEGHAYYDRIGWEPLLSAATGAVLVGLLTMTISSMALRDWPAAVKTDDVLQTEHVARLGGELFSRSI